MLKVEKNKVGDATAAKLLGTIDQSTALNDLFGPVFGSLEVDAEGVSAINSLGTKQWISYFSSLRERGVSLSFTRCSPAIVAQINYFSNFVHPHEVKSVLVPYVCSRCSKEFSSLLDVSDPSQKFDPSSIGDLPCPKCKSPGRFDDSPEDYFNFLMSRS